MDKLKVLPLALGALYFLKLMVIEPVFADSVVFATLAAWSMFIVYKEKAKELVEVEAKIVARDVRINEIQEEIDKLKVKVSGVTMSQSMRK